MEFCILYKFPAAHQSDLSDPDNQDQDTLSEDHEEHIC